MFIFVSLLHTEVYFVYMYKLTNVFSITDRFYLHKADAQIFTKYYSTVTIIWPWLHINS